MVQAKNTHMDEVGGCFSFASWKLTNRFYFLWCSTCIIVNPTQLWKRKTDSAIILSSKRVGDLLGNFVQLWEAKYFKRFSMRLIECYTGKVAIKMLWRRGEEIKGAETSPDKPEMILPTNADPWEHWSFGSETPSSLAFYRRLWKSAWVPIPGSWVRDLLASSIQWENYLFYVSFLASSGRKAISLQWTAAAFPVFF